MEKTVGTMKKTMITENYGTLINYVKKLWYYEKKTMLLYRKLWNFDLLWKKYGTMEKIWYYGKNMVLWKKTMVLK